MKKLVVVGGGFAGIWACAAAAALRHRLGSENEVRIILVSKEPDLVIRPRLYERSPEGIAVPLEPIARTLDIDLSIDEVIDIKPNTREIMLQSSGVVAFDALVLAAGSQLRTPDIPGLAEHTHNVDSLESATRFWKEAGMLGSDATVAVIGAGLTGLELVTEVAAKTPCKTLLVDSGVDFGELLSPDAVDVVHAALTDTEVRFGSRVAAIDEQGITLQGGDKISADIVAWTAGMQAHPLTEKIGQDLDETGRLLTDQCLNVRDDIFAAGDVAHVKPDGVHTAPMSCQFAIPTGMIAGYNALATLTGAARQVFSLDYYVTCMDLGNAGGLLTQGWERLPVQTGAEAKATKRAIMEMIVPPGDRATWFEKAIPEDVAQEGDAAA